MFQIYDRLANEHDLVTLSIALLVCIFGATISLTIGQRALLTRGKTRHLRLCLASLLTGLTI